MGLHGIENSNPRAAGRLLWAAPLLSAALLTHAAAVGWCATWTDASGNFSVEAELVELDEQVAVLRKADGEQIRVPIARLSPASQQQAMALAKQNAVAAPRFGPPQKQRLRIGLEMTAHSDVTGLQGIITVPMEWPEQQVEIVGEDKSPLVRRISYRTLENGARQMMILVPRLAAGETATATATFDLTRRPIVEPRSVDGLSIPARADRSLRQYLAPGPLIPSGDRTIIAATAEAIAGADTPWEQVRAIHAYSIDNIRYHERPEIKDAATALAEGVGDCQELSSLFVAMCRVHGVPARCVWIPNHSYAEFYLEDAAGVGYWYPVESTNKQQFGYLPRTDVILQKGDNFKLPELPDRLHYARTVLYGKTRDGGPQPTFREIFEIEPIAE